MPPEFLFLALLLLLVLAWHNGLAHREIAVRLSRDACERRGFQLLDGSVHLSAMSLTRCPNGNRCLRRRYRFAYSSDHVHRNEGVAILKGRILENIVFSNPGGTDIGPPAAKHREARVYKFPQPGPRPPST